MRLHEKGFFVSDSRMAAQGPISESAVTNDEKKRLLDPYASWAESEGIPVHLNFGHNLLELETSPWDRYDARGCFAHTHGRGDFMANYVLEVEPTRVTRPIKHLYEAFFYVLSGFGSTIVWLPTGDVRTFEWGPKALFAIPVNCKYQIINSSSREIVRLSCTNNAPIVMNLFHNHDFVFSNDTAFDDRILDQKHFGGDGQLYIYQQSDERAQHIWETNFIHDLTSFRLYALESRGRGSKNVSFVLADGTMHAHVSQIPVGSYKKAHRHAAGTHVHAVDGEGYTLLWYEADQEFVRIPWQHGYMYTPPFWMFHQHFNTCSQPARYLACSLGSRRYPFLALRRRSAEGQGAVSVSQGGRQVEYEEQDPRVHRMFLEALARSGVASDMGEIFDEDKILAIPTHEMTGPISTPRTHGPAI